MQLTAFTDFSLRTLIYLGISGRKATVQEIATNFKISKNHLVKVVHQLSQKGFIESTKGKDGGIELKGDPAKMRIGDIVSEVESNMELVECFNVEKNTCPIIGCCDLEVLLYKARAEFINTLNEVTLADLIHTPNMDKKKKALGLL